MRMQTMNHGAVLTRRSHASLKLDYIYHTHSLVYSWNLLYDSFHLRYPRSQITCCTPCRPIDDFCHEDEFPIQRSAGQAFDQIKMPLPSLIPDCICPRASNPQLRVYISAGSFAPMSLLLWFFQLSPAQLAFFVHGRRPNRIRRVHKQESLAPPAARVLYDEAEIFFP
jgi:hypothetical protein